MAQKLHLPLILSKQTSLYQKPYLLLMPINIKIINQGEDHSSGSGVDNETTTDYPIPNIRDNSEHNDSMPISVPNVDTLHDITPSNIDPPAKELDFNNLIIKKI